MNDIHDSKGPIAWMARNHVAANLLMLVLLAGGFFALPNIKQEVFPSFDLDTVTVSVPYPGATPEEVEQGIVLAIEDAIRGVDGVDEISSVSQEGIGSVTAELRHGADGNRVFQDIKNEIDRIITFPEESEEPVVSLNVVNSPVLSLIIYGDVGEYTLKKIAQTARNELTRDRRVTLAEVSGARPLEISFEIPLGVLRKYDLSLEQVAGEIRAATIELGGGALRTEAGEILLRTDERRDRGREYRNIEIISNPDGSRVTLGRIAAIEDGFEEVKRVTRYNGERAVQLTVYRVGDEDPVSVSKAVHEFMAGLEERLPPTVSLDVVNDRSDVYWDRVMLLVKNALLGLVLVMAVLGLFLEVRLAFWVMLGIPISFMGALLLLPLFGVTINMISLFAFIITVGIVVDDAIIVGESIYYERQQGLQFLPAAIRGARLMAAPVTFAILTNILAFVPMLFVPGTMGQIWRNIPVVIILVFAISLVEALFILPCHLAKQQRAKKGRIWNMLEIPNRMIAAGLDRFTEKRYEPFVRWTLKNRYLTFACAVALLMISIGWVVGGHVNFIFFPKVESDQVAATAVLPFGAPFEETKEVEARLRKSALEVAQEQGGEGILQGIYSTIGALPRGRGPGRRGAMTGEHLTGIQVNLVPLKNRDITASEFVTLWRRKTGEIYGLESLSFKFNIGPGADRPINVEVSHEDRQTLELAAGRVAEALGRYKGVMEIDDGIELGKPEYEITLKPEARAAGITAASLARQVRSAYFGAEAKRQQRGEDEVTLYVRLPAPEREHVSDMLDFVVHAPNGAEFALTEAARLKLGRSYEEIRRVDARRVLNVTADVDTGVATANDIVAGLMEKEIPDIMSEMPGLHVTFKGEQETQRESIGGLVQGFGFILLGLYALLAIPFRSYAQPLIIMIAIPFGFIGALAGHLLMGYEMSFVSMLGVVALAGVVINDNILLVKTANDYRSDGASAFDAITAAPCRRLRPVLLTSLTTFLGLSPMMLETSIQARFLIPMALSLGFGILFSTLITLVLVPSLYMLIFDTKKGVAKIRSVTRLLSEKKNNQ
ncbi:MAG: efflux RND transporter permease subunit [Verrucomicrobiota bacterium]